MADIQEKGLSTTEKQKLSLQKDELLREQAHESRKVQLKDDVQLPLKVEHYRKKFEALLVYEEEEHSNLLAEKFVLYVFLKISIFIACAWHQCSNTNYYA